MEKAKIFQSVVKGSNFFTPIVDSYHSVGNHIIELSCSRKDNQHGLYNREEYEKPKEASKETIKDKG